MWSRKDKDGDTILVATHVNDSIVTGSNDDKTDTFVREIHAFSCAERHTLLLHNRRVCLSAQLKASGMLPVRLVRSFCT